MSKLGRWSFLWERPRDFLIVTYPEIFPDRRTGMIFDKKMRHYIGIEDDDLLHQILQKMRDAGTESVDTQDFRPEPTDAVKIIEEGLAQGLPREEINRRLRLLERQQRSESP